jgi:hypothetical protein
MLATDETRQLRGKIVGFLRAWSGPKFVPEDRLLQLLQTRAWLESKFVREKRSNSLVGSEGLGLAIASVERDHQLPPKPLPERMPIDQSLELSDNIAVAPELKVRLDPILECAEPQLVETRRFGARERLVGDIVERRATPKRKGFT